MQPSARPVLINFVTALNASGTQVLYSTYLTGTYGEIPEDLAVDGNGNVYVAGSTISTDYPTTANALQTVFPSNGPANLNDPGGAGPATGYISSLDASGKIRFSTFFGGSATDEITSIAYGFGSIYVGGSATSPDLPGLSVPDHYCLPQQFLTELTPEGKLLNRSRNTDFVSGEFRLSIADEFSSARPTHHDIRQ